MIEHLIVAFAAILLFVVGIGFGAYLQRAVGYAANIRILPKRERGSVESDDQPDIYRSPYHGQDL